MVEAAVARLRQRGVTVALDGISLEEAIVDAGVSRATAYRRWPNRRDFTRAVLIHMVHAARLEPETSAELDAIRAVVEEHRERLDTETGRRTVVVEVLRLATEADHRRLSGSREWRDYLALRVTCDGLPDAGLRETLVAELRATERSFLSHRAAVYARLPELLGYRLAPPMAGDSGFLLMAEAVGALMTGLVLGGGEPAEPFHARAFGSQIEAPWTTASYALTSSLLTFLEPDPAATLDIDRALAFLDAP